LASDEVAGSDYNSGFSESFRSVLPLVLERARTEPGKFNWEIVDLAIEEARRTHRGSLFA